MDLKELLNIPVIWETDFNKPLNDKELFTKEVPFLFKKDFSKNFNIFSLSFNADASGKVTVFNDKEDSDDTGNFTESPFPAIGNNNAMLRYDLNTSLKEAASGAFKVINMNFSSEQDILLSCYKIHPNTNTLQQAFIQDITSLKTIYSGEDILSLAENEGLAVKFKATLDAGLSIAFSDVFSWTLSQLVRSLPKGTDIAGEASAGASFSFSVKINDKFKLFIQKTEGDLYKAIINKAISHSSVGTIGAGIIASIDETDNSFATFMDQIFSALLGEPVEKINNWIDQKISNLNDTEKNLLTKITKRIGIEVDPSNENLLKTQYDAFKTKIIDKTKDIIQKKMELGISYEYKKTVDSSTIFSANMTSEAVKENLTSLLLFKVDNLEDQDGVTVNNYIFSRKETISKKFGFRFSFGNFDAYWFNQKKIVFEENYNKLKNTYHIGFSGQRSHLQGGINQKEWHFNLSGEMNRSVKSPKMDDFEYSSIVHWEDQERKTKPEELADFAEMGIIWNCINLPFEEACKNIYKEIKGKRNVKFLCEIKIPAPEMTHLISGLAQSSTNEIVSSLCSSMPHFSNSHRKELSDLLIYFSLWKLYFQNEGNGNSEKWADLCHKQLSPLFPDLAKWEQSFEKGTTTIPGEQSYQSFVGLTEFNDLFDDIEYFQKGIKELHFAIQNKKAYAPEFVKDVFKKIDDLVISSGQNKTFNITFLGRYMLDAAQKFDLHENIVTKMTIEYDNDQGEKKEMVYMRNG